MSRKKIPAIRDPKQLRSMAKRLAWEDAQQRPRGFHPSLPRALNSPSQAIPSVVMPSVPTPQVVVSTEPGSPRVTWVTYEPPGPASPLPARQPKEEDSNQQGDSQRMKEQETYQEYQVAPNSSGPICPLVHGPCLGPGCLFWQGDCLFPRIYMTLGDLAQYGKNTNAMLAALVKEALG